MKRVDNFPDDGLAAFGQVGRVRPPVGRIGFPGDKSCRLQFVEEAHKRGTLDPDCLGQGVLPDIPAQTVNPDERRRRGFRYSVLSGGLARDLAPEPASQEQVLCQIGQQTCVLFGRQEI